MVLWSNGYGVIEYICSNHPKWSPLPIGSMFVSHWSCVCESFTRNDISHSHTIIIRNGEILCVWVIWKYV
jgi:hypothetical protein